MSEKSCPGGIPISVISLTVQSVVMLIVTIIIPLRKVRSQHTMLPILPNYVPDTHFKIFLMNPVCYVRFRNYLQYCDRIVPADNSKPTVYYKILNCWTCIVSMKFGNIDQR